MNNSYERIVAFIEEAPRKPLDETFLYQMFCEANVNNRYTSRRSFMCLIRRYCRKNNIDLETNVLSKEFSRRQLIVHLEQKDSN